MCNNSGVCIVHTSHTHVTCGMIYCGIYIVLHRTCSITRTVNTCFLQSTSPLPIPLSSAEDEEDDYTEMYAPKVLGDLIESVAGAIFIDSGMELRVVWRVFEGLFVPLIGESFLPTIPTSVK